MVLKQQKQMTEQAESALSNLKHAHTEGSKQLGDMSQQADHLNAELAQVAKQKLLVSTQLQQLQNQLEQSVQRATDQASTHQAALDSHEAQKTELTQTVTQLQAQLASATAGKQSSNLKLTEHIERLKSQMGGAQSQLAESRTQLQEQRRQHETVLADLKLQVMQEPPCADAVPPCADAVCHYVLMHCFMVQQKISCENLASKSTIEQQLIQTTAELDKLKEQLAASLSVGEQLARAGNPANDSSMYNITIVHAAEQERDTQAQQLTQSQSQLQTAEQATHAAEEAVHLAQESQHAAEQALKAAEAKASTNKGEDAWQEKLGACPYFGIDST